MSGVNEAHIYVTDYGDFGFAISSPQLPALAGGALTGGEVQESLFDDAVGAGLSPHGTVIDHLQMVLGSPQNDEAFFVRMRQDFHASERAEVAQNVMRMLALDEGLRDYVQRDSAGDGTVVICLATDRLSSVIASLEPGEPVTLALMNASGSGVEYLGLVFDADSSNHLTLTGLGLGNEATVSDLFASIPGAQETSEGAHERELVLLG